MMTIEQLFELLWVWHMFCGVGLWCVVPPNKIHETHYSQKSTRSTLALKLSVAQPVYLWVTATYITPCWCTSIIIFQYTYQLSTFTYLKVVDQIPKLMGFMDNPLGRFEVVFYFDGVSHGYQCICSNTNYRNECDKQHPAKLKWTNQSTIVLCIIPTHYFTSLNLELFFLKL